MIGLRAASTLGSVGAWRGGGGIAAGAGTGDGCPTSDPIAEEQAALHRATLVAGAAPPEEVFTAVAMDVGRPLQVDYTVLVRNISGWARAAGWSHVVQLRR